MSCADIYRYVYRCYLSKRRDPSCMKTRYTHLAKFSSLIVLRRETVMRCVLRKSLLIITLCFFVTPVSFAGGSAEAGKVKADTCLGCHGVPSYTNVYPTYHVPRLGGQHAEYIIAALKGYQSGGRSHPTMQAHATGLSEEDMADIGAYFQSLQ